MPYSAKFLLCVLVIVATSGFASAEQTKTDQLRAAAEEAYGGDGPGASIIVYKGGEILLHEAFGMASLEMTVPMSIDNRFRTASVTKQFTGATVMALVEDGTLDLDADIRTYLPDFSDKGGVITLRHLLNHTSGLYNYTNNDAYELIETTDISLAETRSYFEKEPLNFPVGTNWSYSNSGYALASMIIEKVTGRDFREVVADRLFKPTGMTHTEFQRHKAIMDMSPNQYWRDGTVFYPARRAGISGHGDGEIYSTTDDLLKWYRALWSGKILGDAAMKQYLVSVMLPDGRDTKYAMGLVYGRVGPYSTFEHGGSVGGWRAFVIMVPEMDTFVAVLANSTRQDESVFAASLAKIALGIDPAGPRAVTLDSAALAKFTGTYRHGPDDLRIIRVEEGRLLSQRRGGSWYELVPIGNDTVVFATDPDTQIIFFEGGLKISYRNGMDHLAVRESEGAG